MLLRSHRQTGAADGLPTVTPFHTAPLGGPSRQRRTLAAAALAIVAAAGAAGQTIERVEPPNWWIGFEHNTLQLLVYGEGVARLRPTVAKRGVTVQQTTTTGNPNYLFVRMRIDAETEPGAFDIRFENEGASLTHRYTLTNRNPEPLPGFTSADAIYLITPDRFANGDPANDNAGGLGDQVDRSQPLARHGGDLRGLAERLDYIAELGFTSIWLNPLLENAMPAYSYHGYATTDFYRVDPRFGSNDDFVALAAAARKRGLGLIMDVIVNHCGLHHWWMRDPPSDDWVHDAPPTADELRVWLESGTPWKGYRQTNHSKTVSLDPYASEVDRRGLYDGWFVPDMPDLNQDNPLMAEYLIQNAIWWIETAGLHGVRMDTYPYGGKEFMAEWTRRVMREYPTFSVVGEEWTPNPLIAAYWQRGGVKHDGYQSWLTHVMDFPVQTKLVPALVDDEQWNSGLITLYESLVNDVLYPDTHALMIFADNHDTPRVFKQLGEDYGLFELAMAYLATMRGVPQIYYATEILGTHEAPGHGDIRSDFPGGWPGDAADAVSGRGLTPAQRQAQTLVRTLFNWRKEQPAIHRGRLLHFLPRATDGYYVYFRMLADDVVMVVLNKNMEPQTLDPARFAEALGNAKRGVDVIRGTAYDLTAPIPLAPRTALVIEVETP